MPRKSKKPVRKQTHSPTVCLSTRSGPLCSSNLAHPKLLINKDEL